MTFSSKCQLKNSLISIAIYNRTQDIDTVTWNKLIPGNNLYLTLPYLSALEDALPDEVIFRYIIFNHEYKGPVGIGALQILDFKGETAQGRDEICYVARKIKERIVEATGFKVITCGNVFACGENGFAFSDELSEAEIANSLNEAIKQVQRGDKGVYNSSLFLLKEFWPESFSFGEQLQNLNYTAFSADVNMVLNLEPEWATYQDYLAAMQAKFRTKANAAEKRSEELVYKPFTSNDIELLGTEIEKLYHAVVDKSPYSFGKLNAKAFVNLKRNLGDQFIFNGYLLNGQLVAFSTAFLFNGVIDANYVGINYKLNQHYALYSRMLYDFVRNSIERGCSQLRLGRTAEEIKSSIGAVPVDMRLYIRHKTSFSNHIVKRIFSTIKPRPYELRKPFKMALA